MAVIGIGHIDALVSAAISYGVQPGYQGARALGTMLIAENLRSESQRARAHVPVPRYAPNLTDAAFHPVAVCALVHHYHSHSSAAPDWNRSEPFAVTTALRDAAEGRIYGNDLLQRDLDGTVADRVYVHSPIYVSTPWGVHSLDDVPRVDLCRPSSPDALILHPDGLVVETNRRQGETITDAVARHIPAAEPISLGKLTMWSAPSPEMPDPRMRGNWLAAGLARAFGNNRAGEDRLRWGPAALTMAIDPRTGNSANLSAAVRVLAADAIAEQRRGPDAGMGSASELAVLLAGTRTPTSAIIVIGLAQGQFRTALTFPGLGERGWPDRGAQLAAYARDSGVDEAMVLVVDPDAVPGQRFQDQASEVVTQLRLQNLLVCAVLGTRAPGELAVPLLLSAATPPALRDNLAAVSDVLGRPRGVGTSATPDPARDHQPQPGPEAEPPSPQL
ncbi:hypothetical protein ACWDUL_20670 [Nocardia niigatensis]